MKHCVALLAVACTMLVSGCCTTPQVTKWEYKQVYTQITDQSLNKLADEGWEVVCVGTSSNGAHFYVLKRPKK
jgi:hypothetical protein